MVVVFGRTVDDETRCVHYRTEKDVVAIRFRCCDRYYPCFSCHEECEDHDAVRWPREEWDRRAVVCGVCCHELTIERYAVVDACPACTHPFNERCRLHAHLYFEV